MVGRFDVSHGLRRSSGRCPTWVGQNRKSSMRAHVFRFGPESGHRMSVMSTHPGSIDAAIPAASWFWAGVIRIDDALGCAARCRHVALCQRGIGAFEVIVLPALVDLQADRVVRIIGLGSSRRRCRSHPNCQNRQSQNPHQTLFSVPCPSTGNDITTGPTTIPHIGSGTVSVAGAPIYRPATANALAGVSWVGGQAIRPSTLR